MGHCSIVNCAGSVCNGTLLAFIPPTVLAVIEFGNILNTLKSCGVALLGLAFAINNFLQPPLNHSEIGKV